MVRKLPLYYRIAVNGVLGSDWSGWLNGFQLQVETNQDGSSTTLLSGEILDQAALRGILNKIWNMNLELISVNRVESSPETDNSSISCKGGQK